MAVCSSHHKELNEEGYGKCSVPMWQMEMPAGFCDHIAFGKPMPCDRYRNAHTGRLYRADGKYSGYVPFLACYGHGGPKHNQSIPPGEPHHFGDPCIYCGTPHDNVEPGPCPARTKERR